ncbi:MAG: hypothetical protein AN188_01257 [Candidatus Methanofastidiosum methylothiophilum]|uniref:Uncharacterized protein n=1 Tax=Candidatus Methanofastidiosum methylothiophilum TaxID=1705564 RepID=A0A150JB31_9EURY|nr:MAG: hypothetical protein AN188_01257 [Candidatus Methanofastidiosum methylthiophilus]
MKYFLPLGEPSSDISLYFNPVSFSANSIGFANVAVEIMNCGLDP